MKISELVKRTNVPKETIHYYIREGLLRKPRKTGKNTVNYNETYVDQIRIIKALQDNYFLPLSVIKEILKQLRKQSPSKQSVIKLLSEYFRPIDYLLSGEIEGENALIETTGLGKKWLNMMEDCGVINAETKNNNKVYSRDDVAIAKLLVDMDTLGFGPKDGYDPKLLQYYSDSFSEFILKCSKEYYKTHIEKFSTEDFPEKNARYTEILGLFFYYLFRKRLKGDFISYFKSMEEKNGSS